MKVEIIKNVFKPFETARAGTILKRGNFHDLDDRTAKQLIDGGYAAPADKPVKKEEKKEEKTAK